MYSSLCMIPILSERSGGVLLDRKFSVMLNIDYDAQHIIKA